MFREALEIQGALPYDDTTERQVPEEIGQAFGVKSQMVVAIRPHSGKAWLLGLHHCSKAHRWTTDERRIFEGAAGRVADALDALVLLRDLRQSETQVAELQRSEALGSLAGGVAHDFNNQLLVILCYSEMLREHLGEGGTEYVEQLMGAAEQAAGLTRQLLAFSRRAVLEPRPVDLSEMVRDSAGFLGRAVGAGVAIDLSLDIVPVVATVDPAQLEQVLVNLVVNARDAMQGSGSIRIATELRAEEGDPDRPAELDPGAFAVLSVVDDGPGMEPEIRRRAFEPFFTTKERGKGTGLGLSTAYGVARQSGGTIVLESTPGEGTTFRVWLPATDDRPGTTSGSHAPVQADGGDERILLVEPNPDVLAVTARILRNRGYRVIEVAAAEDALRELERGDEHIDLLMTELVLPGEDGVHLIERALKLQPSLLTTFCTGYSPPTVERLRTSGAIRRILQKPFTPDALLAHLRYVLER